MDSNPPNTSAEFLGQMERASVKPLWDLYKGLNTREPRFLEPMIWRWAEMEPLIERASREVDMANAERRALMLCHPGLTGTTFTTPTLSAALQILEPGEHAHAHRHTLAALRLTLAGDGAITTTDGKACLMERGDLILTPAGTWHKHYHPGRARAVWLDGLDAPLATGLGTVFFEHGPGPDDNLLDPKEADEAMFAGGVAPERESLSPAHPYSPLFRYPWAATARALAAMAPLSDASRRIRYINPRDGGPVMPTIDCYALQLAAGRTTSAQRSTATAIVAVLDGEGVSQVGDARFDWKANDVFTLPRWQWVEHTAATADARLFLMTDRALIDRIGHLREEMRVAA